MSEKEQGEKLKEEVVLTEEDKKNGVTICPETGKKVIELKVTATVGNSARLIR